LTARKTHALWALLCACCLFVESAFAQQMTVSGRVEFAVKAGGTSPDPSDAVVWLTRVGESTQSAPAQPKRQQLLQKHKTFSPHVLVIQVGSAVEFPNQDPFFHNVFSLFDGKRFDLGLYEAGSTRSVVFNRAGISYIFCNIHPEMSAVVVSLKTPYYATSDRKGIVSIPNVPAGRYEMQIWHERVLPETLNALTHTVTLSAESASLGVLHLPEQRNLSQTHKNKYGEGYDNPTPTGPVYTRP